MPLLKSPSGLALVASALILSTAHAAPPGQGWALAWSDEFEGTALNASNWSVGTGTRRHAVNTANALTVASGYLRVRTYTEGGTHYTGWISSAGKFENAFGYWEARIRFNSSQGMWSAFWLQPYGINNVGDPAGNGTEIDIVEHRSRDSAGADLRNRASTNIHWDGYGADHKSVGATYNNPGIDPASLQGNFHTYGVRWTPTAYYFYLDGALVYQTSAAVSNVRQWIYLTSEVENGAWAGPTPASYGDRSTSNTYFDVDYVRFYQRAEQTVNGSFSNRMGPWRQLGTSSLSNTGGRNGGPGARMNPSNTAGGSVEQQVVGLLPNTPYILRGWGNVGSRSWPDVRFGARGYGGPQVHSSVWSNGFTEASQLFTTGSSNTSATVFAWVPTQYGDCYADDIDLRRAGRLTNGGFELGDDTHWSVFGDALVQSWGSPFRRSGDSAIRLNASATSRGLEQTVYGLKPNTAYTFSAWVRTSGQPIRFGVKNHGAAEAFTSFTGTGNTWQRASRTFTTGSTNTSATLYVFIPDGSNVSPADVDDLLLVEALPSEWTAVGIGSALAGETGSSDGRIVVRGSGNNLGTTSDSCHLVHQPMIDSGKIIARLNSFEADSNVAKAGVMIRASTAANAPFAMVHWLTQGQVEFYWRTSSGGTGTYAWAAVATPYPPLLRLVRAGNVVTASFSTNGTTWTQVGVPQSINLPSSAIAGLAVTSNDTANTAEAVFSNVSFTGDRDSDGLSDDYETNTGLFVSATDAGTDPDNPDTDGDGYRDGDEVLNGTNPLVPNLEFTWQPGVSPGGTGNWSSTAASWRIGSANSAWVSGKTALFGGSAGTVTIGANVSGVSGMIFNTTGYQLSGTGPLGFTPESTITLNAASTDIATPLAGTSALTVSGPNLLVLRGDNRGFTGSISLTGNAQLRAYNTTALTATGNELGGSNTSIEVAAGSFLRWFNVAGTPTYAANLYLNGSGTGGVLVNDSGAANPSIVLNGNVTIDSDSRITGQNSGRFIVNGLLSGPNTLTWEQAATTSILAGNLSLDGLTKTGAGILSISSPTIDVGTLNASAGTLNFNPSTDSIQSGVLTGTATITKTGIGTLILTGANTFGPAGGTFAFGGTNVNAGAIRLAHPQALGNHSKILLNGQNSGTSRLELSGGRTFALNVESWGKDAGNIAVRNFSGNNVLSGSISQTATGGGLSIDALAGTQLTITGNVTNTLNAAAARDLRFSGAGTIILQSGVVNSSTTTPTPTNLTKEGTGTLTLAGTSSTTGTTTVSGGTLVVTGSVPASTITVATSGTLGGSGSIATASIAGKLTPGTPLGTLSASGAVTVTGTWETEINGSSCDRLNVAGTLTLTGSTLDFNVLPGGTTQAVYLIASYGSLIGTPTLVDLPFGYVLHTNYNNLKQIALVRTATPLAIWANPFGLTGNNALTTADPDGDGIPNVLEYLLGSNPAQPGTAQLPVGQRTGNQFTFTFTRVKEAHAAHPSIIESTSSLTSGTWTAVPPGAITSQDNGPTETLTVTLPITTGTPRLFVRLRVP